MDQSIKKTRLSAAPLTCDGQPVELRVRDVIIAVGLARHVVPKADGAQRYEAEVERLQEVPVLLQAGEDPRRDEEEHDGHEESQAGGVCSSQPGRRHAPAPVEVGHRPLGHHRHDPLHQQREQEERHRDAAEGVEDAEGLPFIRERDSVTVTCRQRDPTQVSAGHRAASPPEEEAVVLTQLFNGGRLYRSGTPKTLTW